jgi:hypothetical protein
MTTQNDGKNGGSQDATRKRYVYPFGSVNRIGSRTPSGSV